jgi:RNA polymerase sigma factor (TIGR02999 family)
MAVEPNQWESRAHLIAIASHLMRRILVDEARRARAERRQPITLDLKNPSRPDTRQPSDVIALDEAITRLAKLDSRQSRIVEMYYFGGMTSAEIAAVWDLSARTVERELHLASAALRRILMMPG